MYLYTYKSLFEWVEFLCGSNVTASYKIAIYTKKAISITPTEKRRLTCFILFIRFVTHSTYINNIIPVIYRKYKTI